VEPRVVTWCRGVEWWLGRRSLGGDQRWFRRQRSLLTPKFGKEYDWWVQFEKESVWWKERYF
jgi:hypothetical protein